LSSDLDRIIRNRQNLRTDASNAATNAPDALTAAIAQRLVSAMDTTIQSDVDWQLWINGPYSGAVSAGCDLASAHQTDLWRTVDSEFTAATTAKTSFINAYNNLASRLGVPQWSAGTF